MGDTAKRIEERALDLLARLSPTTVEEQIIVRNRLLAGVPERYIESEIERGRTRQKAVRQKAVDKLVAAFKNDGWLKHITEAEYLEAIRVVENGSEVSQVVEGLRPTIEARIQAAEKLKPA